MKVILKETMETLGVIGSIVNVAKGYARNYLFHQQKAVPATEANLKKLEKERAKLDLLIAKERSVAEDIAKRLQDVQCQITAKVSDEGRLYGSVAEKEIVKALASMEIKVDKKMLLMKSPIKEIGEYKIPIRVYQGVEPEITVEVIAE